MGIKFFRKSNHVWDLSAKIATFRFLCQSNGVDGHIKINVSRKDLLTDSFNQIMQNQPTHLRKRLYITFKGEEGLDYGGVAR